MLRYGPSGTATGMYFRHNVITLTVVLALICYVLIDHF